MDLADIVSLVDDIATKGGHVGLIVIIWFALQAMRSAKKAVENLAQINDNVLGMRKEQAEDFGNVKDSLAHIDNGIAKLEGLATNGARRGQSGRQR